MSDMPILLIRILIAVVVIATCIPVFFLLVNRDAFLQARDTAVIRQDGNRRLGPQQPAQPLALEELPFALLSEVAYQKAEKIAAGETAAATPMEIALQAKQWQQWPPFFASDVQARFAKHHLRVDVWENAPLNTVVVTFGGTDPKDIQDWLANFRWLIPFHDDQYTLVVKDFGKVFDAEYQRRLHQPEGESLTHATLMATGHSLGGGLAQEFAYSLAPADGVPRVRKVYAFDPSPVTGYFSVEKSLRERNRQGLSIDRVYQRREVLAILRSTVNVAHPPSADSPRIREIRFNFAQNWNPVFRHSITELRMNLAATASGGK